jgi:hypothetical protein
MEKMFLVYGGIEPSTEKLGHLRRHNPKSVTFARMCKENEIAKTIEDSGEIVTFAVDISDPERLACLIHVGVINSHDNTQRPIKIVANKPPFSME